jgi:hypothetical protein
MIPLYAFLRGDTMGLVVLAAETDTWARVAAKLQTSASVRVETRRRVAVLHEGRPVPLEATVAATGARPLDRVDVVPEEAP